jgi:RNA polymerase sigma-70 factor (ECF subfamily)
VFQPAEREETDGVAIDVEDYYRRFGPMVLRRCRQLLRHDEKARDAMQDTFVQILRAGSRLEDQAASSLLYRTATNVCLNRLRSERRRPEDADDELVMQIASAGASTSNAFSRILLDRVFANELESTRTIAVLHLLDGMTLEEVAEEVGLSVSGVRKRLRGLKARVKELDDLEEVA